MKMIKFLRILILSSFYQLKFSFSVPSCIGFTLESDARAFVPFCQLLLLLFLLLSSMWVRISLVYLSLLDMSVLELSKAVESGQSVLVPVRSTQVTILFSEERRISVLSEKETQTILLESLNIMACLVFIHFLTQTYGQFSVGF